MATAHATAPRLDRRVTIQQRTPGQDARGQALETWADVAAEVWAAVLPVRGRDYYAAGQLQAPTDVRIVIRWRAGILPGMRVVDRDDTFEIVSAIDVEGRRQTLELMCVQGIRGAR